MPGLIVKKIIAPNPEHNTYAKQLLASGQLPDVLTSTSPRDFTEANLLSTFDQSWLDANFLQPNANTTKGKTYIPLTNSQILPLYFLQ